MYISETTPKISIIIPCYNCEKWIEKCLESINQQTFKDFEVICVNDCSKDNTLDVLKLYKSKERFRMQIISNETNLGPGESRNKAIEAALGDWLCFCDSDDYYDPTFLEKMYFAVTQNASDIAMCEYKKIYEDNKIEIVNYLQNVPTNHSKTDALLFSKFSLCLLIVKKELFNGLKLPNLRNGEDMAIVPCLESRAKFISVVREPLYNYLIHRTSASNRVDKKVFESLINAFVFIQPHAREASQEIMQYWGVTIVLYGATLNSLKANISKEDWKSIINNFEKQYPHWHNSSFVKNAGISKKLYLYFLAKKRYFLCKTLAKIHMRISA